MGFGNRENQEAQLFVNKYLRIDRFIEKRVQFSYRVIIQIYSKGRFTWCNCDLIVGYLMCSHGMIQGWEAQPHAHLNEKLKSFNIC